MMLMRQRKMLNFNDENIERHKSFDTQMGMAFSAINDAIGDDKNEVSSTGSDEDNIERASKDSPSKGGSHGATILETEKHLKIKEAEFVNTI